MTKYSVEPIGIVRTPFNEKFGIPRQSRLVNVPGVVELLPPFNQPEAVDGLEYVSHIWLQFLFSEHTDKEAALRVRPPRLGGNTKVGVFATRSSYRPNGLGLSVVKLLKVEKSDSGIKLLIEGADLLDKTPVLDIKPYLPYADQVDDAANMIAGSAPNPSKLSIVWSSQAESQLNASSLKDHEKIKDWISQLIQLDPRPAYKSEKEEGSYAMAVFGLDIKWEILEKNKAQITSVSKYKGKLL